MSGGIDSTAVCRMLQEQGFRVVGLTLVTCDGAQAAAESAAAVAAHLGIEHHVADIREEFRATVVQDFMDAYLSGCTPNPCVNCNPTMKFRKLEEWAERLGCAHIATGHYVKLEQLDGKFYIVTGDDARKDQSYFLWRLTQRQLSRVMFPLGGWEKDDVRRYLKLNNLDYVAHSGESMEVCFIQGDYRDFLRQNIPDVSNVVKPGAFVDSKGIVIGTHQGFPYYTVGQRKGLGVALGYPAYVLKINPAKNTVMLGTEEQLMAEYMLIDAPQWVDGAPAEGLSVRVRYRSTPIPCTSPVPTPDGRFLVRLLKPAQAITPGQSAVFYINNMVVGGAFIASQRGINQWIKNDTDEQ